MPGAHLFHKNVVGPSISSAPWASHSPCSIHLCDISVKLTIHPQAFFPPDMDGSMAGQHFHLLGAWFPDLRRLHIHLSTTASLQLYDHVVLGTQHTEEVVISAAWLSAHCKLVVTHKLTCPGRNVKGHSGCLSLPLSSHPALE